MDREAGVSGDRRKAIILVSVIAVAVAVYAYHLLQTKSENPYTQPLVLAGSPAPDFSLPKLDGDMVRLSDYRGKVVFLNIWATWCSPCREEMPSMEKLYQQMKGEDFEILAVSIDILGAKAVAPFVKELKLSFPTLLDPDGTVKRLYSTTGVPESFIIDKNGVVTVKIIGPRDWGSPEAVKVLKDLAQKPAGENRNGRGAGKSTSGDK